MDKLNQQIDDMRARLEENARNEQTLLRALSEALNQVDQQLLREVRQVTAEHESRRVAILGELQGLAARLCSFPARDAAAAIDAAQGSIASATRPIGTYAPGDWRRAASNIEDDLDLYADDAGAEPVRRSA